MKSVYVLLEYLSSKPSNCTSLDPSTDIMIEYILVDLCCTEITCVRKLMNIVYLSTVDQLQSTVSTSSSKQTDTSEMLQPVGRLSIHSNGAQYAGQLNPLRNTMEVWRMVGMW